MSVCLLVSVTAVIATSIFNSVSHACSMPASHISRIVLVFSNLNSVPKFWRIQCQRRPSYFSWIKGRRRTTKPDGQKVVAVYYGKRDMVISVATTRLDLHRIPKNFESVASDQIENFIL